MKLFHKAYKIKRQEVKGRPKSRVGGLMLVND